MQIISEQYIQQHRNGLQGMYNAVLDFFPKHYTKLREITTGAGQGLVFILPMLTAHTVVSVLMIIRHVAKVNSQAVRYI